MNITVMMTQPVRSLVYTLRVCLSLVALLDVLKTSAKYSGNYIMYDTEPRLYADQIRFCLKGCVSAQNPDKAESVGPTFPI